MSYADDETEFLGRPPAGQNEAATGDDTVVLGDETAVVVDKTTSDRAPGGNDVDSQATVADTGTTQVIGRRGQAEPQLAPIVPALSRWRYLPAAVGLAAVVMLVFYFSPAPDPVLPADDDNVFPQGVAALELEARSMVVVAVSGDNVDTLVVRLLDLVGIRPASEELSTLLDQVSRYSEMRLLLQRGQVQRIAELRRNAFAMAELEEAARVRIDPQLGSAQRLAALNTATLAWAGGDLVTALNGLRPLAQADDVVALAQLQHYREVIQAYEGIRAGSADAAALRLFYLGLDPRSDGFFWHKLERDFAAHSDAQAKAWGRDLREAGRLWISYHERGGIDGALRQGRAKDNGFGQRAAELVQARRLVAAVGGGSTDLEARLLPRLLSEELAFQRAQLQLLQDHVDESLWQERLALLSGGQNDGPNDGQEQGY